MAGSRSQAQGRWNIRVQVCTPDKALYDTYAINWDAVSIHSAFDSVAFHREEVLALGLSQHIGDGCGEFHAGVYTKLQAQNMYGYLVYLITLRLLRLQATTYCVRIDMHAAAGAVATPNHMQLL